MFGDYELKLGFSKNSDCYYKSNISWDEFFMRHVYLSASKSLDPRTHIGSVLVKDNVIISEGFNGFPRGVYDYKHRYNDREMKLKFIVHAETNSVLNCARKGISTYGSICYTNGIPCVNCAKTLIQAGIEEVVVHKNWIHMSNWKKEQEISEIMFKESQINIRIFDKVLELEGFGDGKIIKV